MIKVIIGLGNPGPTHLYQRHNIGFRILDSLADYFKVDWIDKQSMQVASVHCNNNPILLIKPQTFMNSSGKVIPFLLKQGVKANEILVVHDELEKPFGNLSFKEGGSHKGHNGLKSIIEHCGAEFMRFRFGIGRPTHKDLVPTYVLQNFDKNKEIVEPLIESALKMIVEKIQ